MSDRIIIVKVQAPVASTDPNVGYLLYAEGHKFMVEQQPSPELVKAMRGRSKAYFEGQWNGSQRGWAVGDEVGGQRW